MKTLKKANLRALVIAATILIVMFGYVAYVDLGNPSTFGWSFVASICPLGYLETLLAGKAFLLRPFLYFALGIALVIIFGKIFCAWICPTALIQRLVPNKKRAGRIQEQTDSKHSLVASSEELQDSVALEGDVLPSGDETESADLSSAISAVATVQEDLAAVQASAPTTEKRSFFKRAGIDSRHAVLGASLASAALFGFPVFCLVCPVGLTFASLLIIWRLFSFGDLTFGVLVFPAMLILELLVLRKWCSKICPLGALISLVSKANKTFRPQIDDSKCLVTSKRTNCTICKDACTRENIDPRRLENSAPLNECTKCLDCKEACPTRAISFPFIGRSKQKVE